MPSAKRKAGFISWMLLLKTEKLADKDFSVRYSGVMKGMVKLPDETVLDGLVVAFDEEGSPCATLR